MIVMIAIFFSACADKSHQEYNKPAVYWYKKIVESIVNSDLDKADNYFTSLQSEHIGSPLLEDAMLMLYKAHEKNDEYILANFYMDEYIKKFGTKDTKEFGEFKKILSSFSGLRDVDRNQVLLQSTIKESEYFLQKYPSSQYQYVVNTVLSKLYLTDYLLNRKIALLYKKLDKEGGYELYKSKMESSWIHGIRMKEPDSPWWEDMFSW
jgi:outer membrane protein assembly factor BamD